VCEALNPDAADAIIIQEANSFKNFRYIKQLLCDPFVSRYTEKIFTINTDDCATGLLKGLYTSIPKQRFHPSIHVSVPYMEYPNELVFCKHQNLKPQYLASWRGNLKSNPIRKKMIQLFHSNPNFNFETTNSWLNHNQDEKKRYVDIILNSKFSLCPAGWTFVSFRIFESMALARCPVIIADNFLPPKGPDWKEFALFFPENNLRDLYHFLMKHDSLYKQLGEKAYNAWQDFFSPAVLRKYYATSLLSLIRSTPKTSKEAEIKRWKSLNVFWNNKWTVPQRVVNKIRMTVSA
jgi:hypothetical protein